MSSGSRMVRGAATDILTAPRTQASCVPTPIRLT